MFKRIWSKQAIDSKLLQNYVVTELLIDDYRIELIHAVMDLRLMHSFHSLILMDCTCFNSIPIVGSPTEFRNCDTDFPLKEIGDITVSNYLTTVQVLQDGKCAGLR